MISRWNYIFNTQINWKMQQQPLPLQFKLHSFVYVIFYGLLLREKKNIFWSANGKFKFGQTRLAFHQLPISYFFLLFKPYRGHFNQPKARTQYSCGSVFGSVKPLYAVTEWSLQHAVFISLSSCSSVIITEGWLIKDGAEQNSTRLQVDDLNPSLSQLALSAVILYWINALWGSLCSPYMDKTLGASIQELLVLWMYCISVSFSRLAVSLLKGRLAWSQLSVQSSSICFLQSVLMPTWESSSGWQLVSIPTINQRCALASLTQDQHINAKQKTLVSQLFDCNLNGVVVGWFFFVLCSRNWE